MGNSETHLHKFLTTAFLKLTGLPLSIRTLNPAIFLPTVALSADASIPTA